MSSSPFHIAKFGGTSVGTPERVRRVVELAMAEGEGMRRVVVSSAFGGVGGELGVTDTLLAAIDAACARTGEHERLLDGLRQRHAEALERLAPEAEREALRTDLDALWTATRELLDGVFLLRACDERFRDAIVSAGERASVPLVAAAFRAAGHEAVALDARTLIRTDDRFGEATVDFGATRALVQEAFAAIPEGTVAVVTGFIAATAEGVTTTLGRSGSDYTATILAGALDAAECVIWTDVDGVLSADPRLVPEAFSLECLSYAEAAELAHFGAKVLHPRTMRPLQREGIPLRIANTLSPEHPGTVIGPQRGARGIKALTAVRGAALVRLSGAGVLGVPDLTARAFAALAEAGLDVLLIAQASSEGSLCFAVKESAAERAVRLLANEFARECERGDLSGIEAEAEAAVIAAVGDFMRDAPGLAGKMFATLGRAHVNVRAIAQGASEHTISAVVADADATQAVRALHETFALDRLRAHVFVIGVGVLGRKLLALLSRQVPVLKRSGLNLRLVGVADSERMLLSETGFAEDDHDDTGFVPEIVLAQLAEADPDGRAALIERLTASRLERLIVVDATASEEVAAQHADLLGAGIAVVTPNKAATSVRAEAWAKAQAAAQAGEAPYLYETTVGAGLGIITTLRDLRRTGDTIHRVEGVLSGTLAWVMNRMAEGALFSEAVKEAIAAAYAEPDPRDDLSGRDVARKLATLARELGLPAEAAEASIESLVPEALESVPLDDFLARLPDYDALWQARLTEAGAPLHYLAALEADGGIHAGLEPVTAHSPFAGLQGSGLAVAFHTARYAPHPLVIRGPGASADVTAAVLLADIARAAEAMR